MSFAPKPPESPTVCGAIGPLLPWHANGTLSAAERGRVESHVELCASCRTALAVERRIVEAMRAPRDNVEQSPHAGWQKLLARLDEQQATQFENAPERGDAPTAALPQAAHAVRTRRRRNWSAALGAAVAVQAAAIAVLAIALVRHRQAEEAPRFRTLATADPTLAAGKPLVRVAFESTVTESGARSIAAQAGARILAGPSPQNVYTFLFDDGASSATALEEKVAGLRRHASVLLVEPVILGHPAPK